MYRFFSDFFFISTLFFEVGRFFVWLGKRPAQQPTLWQLVRLLLFSRTGSGSIFTADYPLGPLGNAATHPCAFFKLLSCSDYFFFPDVRVSYKNNLFNRFKKVNDILFKKLNSLRI
jgi:hypothetical protein